MAVFFQYSILNIVLFCLVMGLCAPEFPVRLSYGGTTYVARGSIASGEWKKDDDGNLVALGAKKSSIVLTVCEKFTLSTNHIVSFGDDGKFTGHGFDWTEVATDYNQFWTRISISSSPATLLVKESNLFEVLTADVQKVQNWTEFEVLRIQTAGTSEEVIVICEISLGPNITLYPGVRLVSNDASKDELFGYILQNSKFHLIGEYATKFKAVTNPGKLWKMSLIDISGNKHEPTISVMNLSMPSKLIVSSTKETNEGCVVEYKF